MPATPREHAAMTAVETNAQALHEIAVAADSLRLAVSRHIEGRAAAIAQTHIDTAVLWAEHGVRK